MAPAYDLERFVAAQRPAYAGVVAELQAGRKRTHWIWYIFPQVAGLGTSPTSERYAIRSINEARAYLAHSVLGPRLHECAGLLLATKGLTADDVFHDDAKKVRSSMTLFHLAAPDDPVFRAVLDRFYGGVADPRTEAFIAGSR